MSTVDTLQFDHGLRARIEYDDFPGLNPYADDCAVHIVVLHGRYIDPSDGACGRTPEEVAAWQEENSDTWFTIPLFLYDHGGTVYRVGHSNPFHCPWDSGRVGIIALKRSEWGSGNEPDEKLAKYAGSIAYAYTHWANGEVYGYVLTDSAGRELDSCWGLHGMEAVRQAAAEAATSHEVGAVAQSWGLRCPSCGDCEEIDIAASVWIRLCPNGTDTQLAANGDHEWSDDHAACCNACGFHGTVGDFAVDGKEGAS